MRASAYLIDTGLLIAVLDEDDQDHAWAIRTLDLLDAPLFTCEAVLPEAWFLARRGGADPVRVLDLARVLGAEVLPAWRPRMEELLRQYANRTSIADASLLALAEDAADRVVVATDVEDFSIYRVHHRQAIPALMPPS